MLFKSSKRTLNIKDKEQLTREFQKTRDQYIKDVNLLRKKYKESLVNIVLSYSSAE